MHNQPYYNKPAIRPFSRTIINTAPVSRALIRGDANHKNLQGVVNLYPVLGGTLVTAEVHGLPTDSPTGIFAMHIHAGESCTGNQTDPFANTGGHYNPTDKPHPLHKGDLLPLFGNQGFAYESFFTDRFVPEEVIGKTVVIHSNPDDFKTQPSGASGAKIACGEIRRV